MSKTIELNGLEYLVEPVTGELLATEENPSKDGSDVQAFLSWSELKDLLYGSVDFYNRTNLERRVFLKLKGAVVFGFYVQPKEHCRLESVLFDEIDIDSGYGGGSLKYLTHLFNGLKLREKK